MKFGDAIKLLELTPPVTKEQIKKQYREMCKRYSPDLTQTSNTEPLFRLVIEAYKLLWDGFDMFFSGKAFMPPPKAKPQARPQATAPPPKTKVKTKQGQSGNLWVEIDSGIKLEIEKFSNGKSIRSIQLPNQFYQSGVSPNNLRNISNYRVIQKDLEEYLDYNRDEYEWFARIYGCSPVERQILIDCGFHPLFPQDNPPSLTYLHRDIL